MVLRVSYRRALPRFIRLVNQMQDSERSDSLFSTCIRDGGQLAISYSAGAHWQSVRAVRDTQHSAAYVIFRLDAGWLTSHWD